MPRRRKERKLDPNGVRDLRHADARRKNNPPAGIALTYEVRERQTTRYAYDPHLDPQLVWAGKAEHTFFEGNSHFGHELDQPGVILEGETFPSRRRGKVRRPFTNREVRTVHFELNGVIWSPCSEGRSKHGGLG